LPKRGRQRGLTGFTLMEVLLSSMIMAFVLVSTIAVLSHSSTYVADLRLRARSSQVLQQRLEELRTMNWEQVTNCPPKFVNSADANGVFAGQVIIDPYQYKDTTVTVVRATVLVTWTNRHSRVVTNNLATLISQEGLNKTTL
jgi:type II secretory pathway pseudopilin PulG